MGCAEICVLSPVMHQDSCVTPSKSLTGSDFNFFIYETRGLDKVLAEVLGTLTLTSFDKCLLGVCVSE